MAQYEKLFTVQNCFTNKFLEGVKLNNNFLKNFCLCKSIINSLRVSIISKTVSIYLQSNKVYSFVSNIFEFFKDWLYDSSSLENNSFLQLSI